MIMSATAIEVANERNDKPDNGMSIGEIRRTACYVPTGSGSLFAWLHEYSDNAKVQHGVIICPPIGHEQLHSHRALRHLADHLALDSVPVLRFDWSGRGDSPGNDEDPDRYSTWLSDIKNAVQWMRRTCGCHRVTLIGLRLGATLAAQATTDCEVDNLVLWAPVQKGRTYVREMKAIGLTSAVSVVATPDGNQDIEAAGFTLSSRTIADLGQIELKSCRPQCRRVLVVVREDLPDGHQLCDEWAKAGIAVEQIACPGYFEMMTEPHRTEVPQQAICDISNWLSHVIKSQQGLDAAKDSVRPGLTRMSETKCESLDTPPECDIRESTFEVDCQPGLFGIITEPATSVENDLPIVVLLNAGSANRTGPGRLNVFMARHFASIGFRCLRLDLGGIGDSPCESEDRENDPYPATAFRDIDRTIEELVRRYPTKRIVLMGLCSGAYAAFQAAAQLPNRALIESVLINPLTFFWKDGMTLETAPSKQLTTFHYHFGAAIQPRKWLKLVSGRSKIGIVGAFQLLARRLKLLDLSPCACRKPALENQTSSNLSHPPVEDLSADLRRIAETGRHLAMFFSSSDPGFGILNFHARREATRQRSSGRLDVEFIDKTDHTFSTRAARSDLIQAVSAYLIRRYSAR